MPHRTIEQPSRLAHLRRPAGLPHAPEVRRREVGRRSVVSFAGELDVATAPRLERAIASAIERGVAQVWVDLRETTFMDSVGVHTLLRAQRELTRLNRGFALICADGPVRRVLDITRAADLLTVHPDVQAAHRAA